MSYYHVKTIEPWLHSICDPFKQAHIYLIVGATKAIVYDTGHGIAPLMPVIRSLTLLPVTCVLSHAHGDHANGAYEFEQAFIPEKDMELCYRHTGRTARKNVVTGLQDTDIPLPEDFDSEAYIALGATGLTGKLQPLALDTTFDLGGLTVKVIDMPGHTQGHIGLLIAEHRVLLTSDAAAPRLQWLFLNESTDVKNFTQMLGRTLELPFDTFYDAHSGQTFNKSHMTQLKAVAEQIEVTQSTPFPELPQLNGLVYSQDDIAIIFNETKL